MKPCSYKSEKYVWSWWIQEFFDDEKYPTQPNCELQKYKKLSIYFSDVFSHNV